MENTDIADQEGNNENTDVVKSGDLSVTAKAAEWKRVLQTWISDMDTLTFKTSESVEINKITLERYGYNSDDSDKIIGIWLEDENGNVIAEPKTLTKDKVTLSIKKDYRKVDGTYTATVVVETKGASLGTIGFKVTDADSTAKNLNVDNYNPYTYEIIDYTGSEVTVNIKWSNKNYNYEEGKSYEIARLQIKATNKDILVNGFTLTNDVKGLTDVRALDMKEFLDDLTVVVNSKEIKAKATVNKDDELVVTFNESVEVAMNKTALFVLSASFKDFDAYGDSVRYYVAESADINAVEKKNTTRVTLSNTSNAFTAANWKLHTFAGGKIKLANKKLGKVDAAQASEWTVVAEGDVTITEPISKMNFTIYAKQAGAQYIDSLTMVVNDEEYEVNAPKFAIQSDGVKSSKWDIVYWNGKFYQAKANEADQSYVWDSSRFDALDWLPFNFKNVDIEKSGKIQFKLNIKDDSNAKNQKISFTTLSSSAFEGAKYDNTNKYVQTDDVAGSISFSEVSLQAAKAALENNLTKDVEFLKNETNRKVVFDGTYTAKKADIDLNKFTVNAKSNAFDGKNKVTFYLFIDGEEVADANAGVEETFSDVRVKAGESVKVKVEAEVEAYGDLPANAASYELELKGTDVNGNEDTGKGSDILVNMKIKEQGSVTIPATSEAKTALVGRQNQTIAKFTVKPSNGNEGITLDEMILEISGKKMVNWSPVDLASTDLRVKVGGVEQDDDSLTYSVNEEIPTEWLVVEVTLKPEVFGEVNLNVYKVNTKEFNTKYSKYFVPSLVSFTKQDEWTTYTEYTLNVEHWDDAYAVTNFTIFGKANKAGATCEKIKVVWDVTENTTTSIYRGVDAQEICKVTYTVTGVPTGVNGLVEIEKFDDNGSSKYPDYFKVGGKDLAVPAK